MPKAFIDAWSEDASDVKIPWFAEAVDLYDDTVYAGSIADTKNEAIAQCKEEAIKIPGMQIIDIEGVSDAE